MFSHDAIWGALDSLAKSLGFSPSALAKKAGLDPTAFNKSKRVSPDGKPRWPSTESLSKVLSATGTTLPDLLHFLDDGSDNTTNTSYSIPLITLTQVHDKNAFDGHGMPNGSLWTQTNLPAAGKNILYALQITHDNMSPIYSKGDTLIINPTARIRKNDRVVVRLKNGGVLIQAVVQEKTNMTTFRAFNANQDVSIIANADIAWMARIVWASQ